jgi:hypothetical protein
MKWSKKFKSGRKTPPAPAVVDTARYYRDVNDIMAHVSEYGRLLIPLDLGKFRNATVTRKTYGKYGNIFIVGETSEVSVGQKPERRYTVRAIDPWDATLSDLSEVNQFGSLAHARRWAESIAEAFGDNND